jgi:hypothetical protein
MPVIRNCENCGRPFPIYRLAGVLLDGRIQELCPRCCSTEAADAPARDRLEVPYAPRPDQGAIQPSTTRDAW